MEPTITKILENDDTLDFTIQNCDVSVVNGIRRTILSEIPVNAFITEKYDENRCNIKKNTTRFHNEILKQRLSCIPIHQTNLELLPNKYILELSIKNETSNIINVTTADFKIKDKETNVYMPQEEVNKIFPSNDITGDYILFVRLRPKISDTIPGEEIDLECDFSVSNAKNNSMYNVTSVCSFGNTIDMLLAEKEWDKRKLKMQGDGLEESEIEFEKKNFYILDAQRYYLQNSFDFKVKTIGIYSNKQLINLSCNVIINKFKKFIESIDADIVPINISETTMDNSYDIVLENEDYTMGKLLEYHLYTRYFEKEKIFSFCGFKKFHPHNDDSTIRISYIMKVDKNLIRQHLKTVSNAILDIFTNVNKLFV